ncbi:hypothetical protein LCGC14_0045160 [marine sediment metagenome]|nr:N-6 DNA methylase [Sulfitobacter litoralis]
MKHAIKGMQTLAEHKKAFLSLFSETARYHHRFKVFCDFVTVSAIALRNTQYRSDPLEAEYHLIMKAYEPDDRIRLCELYAITVMALELGPEDFLGDIFMDLELGDARRGQFYTPKNVSKMMAEMSFANLDERLKEKPFITISEPACGAGGMILPIVDILMRSGHRPEQTIWVQAVDVDRTAALMCYIQFSLWAIPAEVIVGNCLTLEIREVWHTPMHHMMGWRARLKEAPLPEGFLEAAE